MGLSIYLATLCVLYTKTKFITTMHLRRPPDLQLKIRFHTVPLGFWRKAREIAS